MKFLPALGMLLAVAAAGCVSGTVTGAPNIEVRDFSCTESIGFQCFAACRGRAVNFGGAPGSATITIEALAEGTAEATSYFAVTVDANSAEDFSSKLEISCFGDYRYAYRVEQG